MSSQVTVMLPLTLTSSGTTGPGTYPLSVSIRANVAPGCYVLKVGPGYDMVTNRFQSLAASAMPAQRAQQRSHPDGTLAIGGAALSSRTLAALAVSLLCLASLLLVPSMRRRRRAAAKNAP